MRASCAEMAEWIDVLFGMNIPGDPRNVVLDGGPYPHNEGEGSSMQLLPDYFCHVFTCAHAVSRYCFRRRLCVCLHEISKTTDQQLM